METSSVQKKKYLRKLIQSGSGTSVKLKSQEWKKKGGIKLHLKQNSYWRRVLFSDSTDVREFLNSWIYGASLLACFHHPWILRFFYLYLHVLCNKYIELNFFYVLWCLLFTGSIPFASLKRNMWYSKKQTTSKEILTLLNILIVVDHDKK